MVQVAQAQLPSVAPTGMRVPSQSISTPQAAFGASTAGEALGALGNTLNASSDAMAQHAERFQAINNKTIADQRTIDAEAAISQLTLDYRSNNRGMAAFQNLSDFHKSVEETRTSFAKDLTPAAALEYEASSRRIALNAMNQSASFAATERKEAVVSTSTAKVNTLTSTMVTMDPESDAFKSAALGVAAEIAFQGSPYVSGLTPEVQDVKLREALGSVYAKQVDLAQSGGDQARANELFAKYKGDMTGDQVHALSKSLRVGNQSFDANSKRMAWANGDVAALVGGASIPSDPTDPNAPRGQRNNNPLNITTLGGGKQWDGQSGTDGKFAKFATEQDGWNAAHRNLEAKAGHGLDTLQGIIGDPKWGWAPASDGNNVAAYVASVSESTGLAPDQKVDLHDPKTRDKILTAMAEVELGHPYSRSNAVANGTLTIPRPQNYTDPAQFTADSLTAAQNYVDVAYKDNPTQGEKVLSAIHAQISLDANVMTASQRGVYYRLAQAAQDGDLQDEAALANAYPGAKDDLAALAPQYKLGLTNDLKRNANEVTPERADNLIEMRGMAATDPTAFAAVNLAQKDLPAKQRLQLAVKQKEIQDKKAKVTAGNKVLNSALYSAAGNSTLIGLGIVGPNGGVSRTSPEYFQFAGAMEAKIEGWMAENPNKSPAQKDIDLMTAQTAALIGTGKKSWFGLGAEKTARAFVVPEEERKAILTARPELEGNEMAISLAYQRAHARSAK